jgi:hypothetical protein
MELLATCVVAAVAWGAHALCGRLAHGPARVGLEVTLFAGPIAGLVWLYGVAATFPGDWSDPCGDRDVGFLRKQDDYFPPSSLCTWQDGVRAQQVPSWVAPVLYASLVAATFGALVLLGTAVVGSCRGRSASRSSSE